MCDAWPAAEFVGVTRDMHRETMSPRERWLAALGRRNPDRVPMDYWATPEMDQKLLRHFGRDDIWDVLRLLHIDRPVVVAPAYVGPPRPPGTNDFGVVYRKINYGTGTYDEAVYHPLAKYESVAELEAEHVWPQPDWFDYSVLASQVAGKE